MDGDLYPRHRLTRRRYKIAYAQLFAAQSGRCAICTRGIGEYWRWRSPITMLVIDHCHQTGKLRGLICAQCNTHVGNVERGKGEMVKRMGEPVPDFFAKIIAYLEHHGCNWHQDDQSSEV